MKKIGAILAVIALVVLDQWSKIMAVSTLKDGHDIRLWPDVFHLTYVENRGAAFGMLQGKQTFFIIMTVLVLIGIIWYWKRIPNNKWGILMRVAFILIIAGASGNLIDRVTLNYVRDFFYFVLIDFPVFNVADMWVVIGVIALFPAILFGETPENEQAEEN